MKTTFQLLERRLGLIFLVYGLLLLGLAIFAPITGDYCPYLLQWHHIYSGFDPWANRLDPREVAHIPWFNFCSYFFARNAYGPLFNLYGLTSIAFPTIPRAIGAVLFLIITWNILGEIRASEDLSWRVRFWLYIGIFGNFFSFVLVGITGGNDVYLAFFICAAIIALNRGYSTAAGMSISLGALIKFYPLWLVPFMALDRRRLNTKFIAAATATFVIGGALAYAKWGTAIFEPLLFNLDRNASRSSIMYILLGGIQSVFHISIPASWVVISLFPLAVAALTCQYILNLSKLTGFMIGYLLILTFNQVGYVVYYFPLMLAIYLYYLYEKPSRQLSQALLALFVIILFRSLFYPLETLSSLFGLKSLCDWARVSTSVLATLVNLYVLVELIRQRQDSTARPSERLTG